MSIKDRMKGYSDPLEQNGKMGEKEGSPDVWELVDIHLVLGALLWDMNTSTGRQNLTRPQDPVTTLDQGKTTLQLWLHTDKTRTFSKP